MSHRKKVLIELFVFVLFLLFCLGLKLDPLYNQVWSITESSHLKAILILIILSIPAFYLPGWKTFDLTQKFVKRYVCTLSIMLTSIFALSGYDFFRDSWLLTPRLILIISVVLVYKHPWFLLPNILLIQAWITGYFGLFGHTYVGHYNTLVLVQLFTFAIYIVHLLVKGHPRWQYVIALISIHLASYFLAGITKILMSPTGFEWIFQNETWLLPLNANLRGWAAQIPEYSTHIFQLMSVFQWLPNLIIVIIEVFVLFAFYSRRYFIYKLASLSIFHLIVVAVSGVTFWIWLLHNGVLILLIWRTKVLFNDKILFRRGIYYTLAFAFTFFITRQVIYTWFDTRSQWYVEYELSNSSGQLANYDRNEFKLYSEYFTQDYIKYAIDDVLLNGSGYGGNYIQFNRAKNTPIQAIMSSDSLGTNYFDPAKSQKILHFLKNYFSNQNNQINDRFKLKYQGLPKHLYMFQSQNKYQYNFKPEQLRLKLYQYHFDGEMLQPISDTLLYTIDLK